MSAPSRPVPQHPWMRSRADDIGLHQRRYERGELEAKLSRNGFEVIFSTSYTGLLLPLMIVSRLMGRGAENNDGIDGEFDLNPRVNRLFTAIVRAEVRLALAGFRWPVGGSRVVVGRAV
jgi:hypothetical protein